MDDELRDDDLRRGLRGLAGTSRDAASELESLRPRFRRARRRRQMQLLGAGMACVAVLGGVTASLDRGDRTIVQHTTNGGSTTVASEPPPTWAGTSTMPAGTVTTIVQAPARPPDSAPSSPSSSAVPPATSPSPTSPAPSTTATTALPVTAPLSSRTSPGGSIAYRAEGGVLALVSIEPAPGFTATVKDQRPDRITVRFERRDGQSSEIDVRIDHGQVQVEVK